MNYPEISIDKTPAQMASALIQRYPGKYTLDQLLSWPVKHLTKAYLRYASSIREIMPYLWQFAHCNGLNPRKAHTVLLFYRSLE
jgi:hypothetical protein